jgi:hypothetical protein
MKALLSIVCLAGAAGAWAFALYAPKAAKLDPLPERFVGEFRLAGFDPPKGSAMTNPLPPGRAYLFRFSADGTYSFSVLLNGNYEVLRREGIVSVDEAGIMTLTPISSNRREDRSPAQRFHAEWGQDDAGPFLALRDVEAGSTFRLK